MRKSIVLYLLLLITVFLAGCNTLNGLSQDVRAAWNYTSKTISKTDAWLQQKAW